jgi:hypothetical protein
MGTSSSQGSPPSRAWDAAKTGYQSSQIPAERLSHLLWRAAGSSAIAEHLASDLVQQCIEAGTRAKTAPEALERMTDVVLENGSTNFGVDIARRAVITSFGAKDRYAAATAALFAEAARYLVSRDAPTFLGVGDRISSIKHVSELEHRLSQSARDATASIGKPPKDAKQWSKHVERILSVLKGSSS